MLFKNLTLIFLLLLAITANSQTTSQRSIRITGTVVDIDTNQPLEYATLVLESIDDPSKITGGVTDSNGKFNVQTKPGNYNIKVEYISYKSYSLNNQSLNSSKNLGLIKLAIDVAQLDAVEIVGEKTTVQIQLDKKVFNVGKDITSQGTDALNVLDNVPSVAVDIEGNISLRGSDNVRVLINGRPANTGVSGSDLLRQLPSDAIERVEVITNPSARYDAEGSAGILNIILKKGEGLGFNGSIQGTIGYYANARTNANLNYKTKKINLFSSLGSRYRKSPGGGFSNTRYFDEATNATTGYLNQTQDRERGGEDYNIRLGAEYYFNERNTLLASFSYNNRDNQNITDLTYDNFNENNTLTSTRLRSDTEIEDRTRKDVNINYESKFNEDGNHKLTIIANYNDSKETENSTITNDYTFGGGDDGIDISLNDEKRSGLLLQADYVLPFNDNEGQFEIGYKSIFNEIKSDVEIYLMEAYNEGLSNNTIYNEDIHAFYSQYGNSFGQFTFLAGLRLEISEISIESILGNATAEVKKAENFFPTLHFGYEIKENETIQASYSRRIRRPRFWDLNPFFNYTNDTNRFSGNPNLNPMFTDAYEIGYLKNWKKFTLNTSIYYRHSTDLFQRITVDTGDTFIIESYEDKNNDGVINENDLNDNNEDGFITEEDEISVPILSSRPINTGKEDRIGLELALSYNPAKWLRLSGDFNLFSFKQNGNYETIVNGNLETRALNGKNTSWFARINSQITLPHKIGFQVRTFYRAPFDNGFNKNKSMLGVNLGMSKDIFDDNATINFNISDLLNTRKGRNETFGPSFYTEGEFQWRKRQINLTFTYRFNQKKGRQRGDRNGGFENEGGEG